MKVHLTYEAWHRMRLLVNASYPESEEDRQQPYLREISGAGLVKQLEDGDLLVYETFLMPHEATAGFVDLTTDDAMNGWAELVTELATGDAAEQEKLKNLQVWWHSHPFGKGTPHFSSVDTGTMEKWQLPNGFLLSIVTNEFGELSIRYDQWTPTRQRLELPYVVMLPEFDRAEVETVRDEVKSKVTFPAPKPATKFESPASGWTGVGQTELKNPTSYWKGGADGSSWMKGFGATDNNWQVWRVDVPKPYKVDGFRKKAHAEQRAKELAQSMSYEYVVRGKNEEEPETTTGSAGGLGRGAARYLPGG